MPTDASAEVKASSTTPSSRTVVPAISSTTNAKGPITSVHTGGHQRVGGNRRRTGHAPPARTRDHPHPRLNLFAGTDVTVGALGIDALPAPRHRGQWTAEQLL